MKITNISHFGKKFLLILLKICHILGIEHDIFKQFEKCDKFTVFQSKSVKSTNNFPSFYSYCL